MVCLDMEGEMDSPVARLGLVLEVRVKTSRTLSQNRRVRSETKRQKEIEHTQLAIMYNFVRLISFRCFVFDGRVGSETVCDKLKGPLPKFFYCF